MSGTDSGPLAGRRVLLTGCVANIGRATALTLARNGASLALADLNPAGDLTATAVMDGGGEAEFFVADVADEAAVASLMEELSARFGGLDVIINNAGIQRAARVTEMAVDDWDALMRVNVRSCFLTAKYGLRILRRPGGVIVNMASLAAVKGGPGLSGYSASKGAIVAFTRALAAEVAVDGIRANALCPGWVDTPFNDPAQRLLGGREQLEAAVRTGVPLARQARPEEIADAVLFLASDASSYMTAQALIVDGGVA